MEEFLSASSWLGGAVLDFAGGDRVVLFDSSTSRSDFEGASLAVLEMWAMASLTHGLVATEQSSFLLPASAMFPKPTAAFAVKRVGTELEGSSGTTLDGTRVERHGFVYQCSVLEDFGEPSCATRAGRNGCW